MTQEKIEIQGYAACSQCEGQDFHAGFSKNEFVLLCVNCDEITHIITPESLKKVLEEWECPDCKKNDKTHMH